MLGKLAIVTTVALALRLLAPGALAELERLILKDNGLVCFENGGIAGKTEAYDAYIEEFLSQEDPNGLPRVADSTAYRPLTIRDDIVYDQNGNAIGILSGSAAPEAPQISKEPSEPEKRPSAPAASTPAEVYSSSTTVYAKASASGKELATLEKGTRLDILSSHGEWVKISFEGNEPTLRHRKWTAKRGSFALCACALLPRTGAENHPPNYRPKWVCLNRIAHSSTTWEHWEKWKFVNPAYVYQTPL